MLEYRNQEVLIEHNNFKVVPTLDKVNLVIFNSDDPHKVMTFPLRLFGKLGKELSNHPNGGGTYRDFFTDWPEFRSYANYAMRYDNSVEFVEGESSPILRLHNFIIYHGRQNGHLKIHDLWLEQATPNDSVIPLELVDLINDKYTIGYDSFKQQISGSTESYQLPPSALF